MECLKEGKFPNGKKLTDKDIEDCKYQVRTGNEILRKYGCKTFDEDARPAQLQLF